MANTELIYFCPSCASSSIEHSTIFGSQASCKACKWSGVREELFITPVTHEFKDNEQMLHELLRQVVTLVAKSLAQPLGRLLLQWGFMDKSNMSKRLPLYLKSMGAGAVQGLIQAREFVEKQVGRDDANG